MAHVSKTKVFMNDGSQCVVIPAEYRFTTNEVCIRRDPRNGDLVLSQSPANDALVGAEDAYENAYRSAIDLMGHGLHLGGEPMLSRDDLHAR